MTYPFVQARWFREGGNHPVDRVVVHRMEAPLREGVARAVARYFQTTDRKSSAHACADPIEVVECVRDGDTAYHAPPNRHSVGLELPGYSKDDDWGTEPGQDALLNGARWTAQKCREHAIPVVWLSPADLRAGKRGVTSHHNVSLAFGQSTHTDPGPHFPVEHFLNLVRGFVQHKPQEVLMARYPQIVPGLICETQLGVVGVDKDGNCYAEPPEAYKGGYPSLAPELRQGEREVRGIQPNDRGGYDLLFDDLKKFSFPL